MQSDPIKLSCRTAIYRPFESIAFEHLASLGVRWVEVVAPEAAAAGTLRDELARHELSAASLHCRCDLARPDYADQIAALLPSFETLGVGIAFISAKIDESELDQAYQRLHDAAQRLASQGVVLAAEMHPPLFTNAQVARQSLERIGHDHMRLNYDTANIYFYNRDVDAVAELRAVADAVAGIHLKDTLGAYRTWAFPALGRGVVDFPAHVAVLREAGFEGPYTLETEGFDREERTERMVCDRIAESIGYLRGCGLLA